MAAKRKTFRPRLLSDEPIEKLISYLRLSKPKKGKNKDETIRDAYGIEHQRQQVEKIREQSGAVIVAEFVEIETGTKKRDRAELDKAIHLAKMHNAVLAIGKLDRLARNVHFIAGLMESGVEFIICNNPHADKFTIHILAALAEREAEDIATRTRDGLAVAKEKGLKLGSARPGHWDGREHLRGFRQAAVASAEQRTQRALAAYKPLMPTINQMKGTYTLSAIAERLNSLGCVTTAGEPFNRKNLHRIMQLFERVAA